MNTLLSQKTILEFAKENYSLDEPQTCEFIRRGFNDHYQLTAGNTQYIFRVYLNGKYYVDSPNAFQFELDLVDYLYKQDIPVAHPLPQKDGKLLGWIDTDLGKRYTALFSYALGEPRQEEPPTVEQCIELGKTTAAFHLAANKFHSGHKRYHLNLKYLAEEPLKQIALQDDEKIREFREFIASLQPIDQAISTVQALNSDGDEYGIIHGDLHLGNMHFQGNQVTLFDFDHCAYGWRAYDLIPSLFLPEDQRNALLQGYESVRPLSKREHESLPAFTKLRGLWDVGDILATASLRAEPDV